MAPYKNFIFLKCFLTFGMCWKFWILWIQLLQAWTWKNWKLVDLSFYGNQLITITIDSSNTSSFFHLFDFVDCNTIISSLSLVGTILFAVTHRCRIFFIIYLFVINVECRISVCWLLICSPPTSAFLNKIWFSRNI